MIIQRKENLETDFGLMETFCHAVTVTDWFDSEKVNIDKYPVKYHRALITQTNIGWRLQLLYIIWEGYHKEWLKLQGSYMTTNGTHRDAYIFGEHLSVVEVSMIKSFIKLYNNMGTNNDMIMKKY